VLPDSELAARVAKLWPHREHESNNVLSLLCRIGLHRWRRLDVLTLVPNKDGKRTSDAGLPADVSGRYPAEDAERVILTASELRQKLRSEPTNLVPRMLDSWKEQVPAALLQYLDWHQNLYGFVGMKDFTLYPIVRPGSFVQIDPRQKKIPSLGWHGDHDRPIFFFELRDSYLCGWCELHDNDLILVPSHESGRQARHVRYPNNATVVGRVTALNMRIADAA